MAKILREQAKATMTSAEATEEMDALEMKLNAFFHEFSDKVSTLRPYFRLTDQNYNTDCLTTSDEVLEALENVSTAWERLKSQFDSAM